MSNDEFKRKLLSNIASKKFQALLGAVLLTISTAIAHGVSWQQAQLSVVVLVAGYMGVQGIIDFQIKKNKTKNSVSAVSEETKV